MFTSHPAHASILASLLLVAGCSNMGDYFPPSGDHPIRIGSEPSGADVYVMGEKIGVTPLELSRKEVFPNAYPKEKESLYGRVTLRKEGCADFTRTISTEISSHGLRASLDCAAAQPAAAPPTVPSGGRSETVEQRLEKIRDLLGKGLITAEEAQKARERILGEL